MKSAGFLIFGVLSLMVSSVSHAQESASANQIYLDEKDLLPVLGENWQGVLLVCKPYCRPVSQRKSNVWNPPLTGEIINKSWLKPVSESDPLFPLLVEPSTVPNNNQQKNDKDSESKEKKKSTLKDPGPKVPPKYSKMPFNFAYNFDMGLQGIQRKISTSNSIQSETQPDGAVIQPFFRLGLMKGQPNQLFGQWFQQRIELLYNMSAESKAADGSKLSYSSMAFQYQMWITKRRFKTGPRIIWMSDKMTAESDTLTHSSTSWTGFLLGWSFMRKRWNFFADTVIDGTITDKAGFRGTPFDQKFYRAGVEYCSKNMSVFDISFGYCGSLSYVLDSQTSGLASNLLLGDKSEIDSKSIFLRLTLRFGEDFYQ
jgi:hypothetical protein